MVQSHHFTEIATVTGKMSKKKSRLFTTLMTKITMLRFRVATYNNKKSQRLQRELQHRDFFCIVIS